MQLTETPPQFPERALPSKAVLYRPLQDLDIYVEDEGSEVFYTELLKRLLNGAARISTVIPLRGRDNVLKAAQRYSEPRRAIFLIDGDLHWVADMPLPSSSKIFVHPCYCVENYLFCEQAMVQIVVENHGGMTAEDAQNNLGWTAIHSQLEIDLVPLFVEFAVAFVLCPEIKTIAHGIGSILRNARGTLPTIDRSKVVALREGIKAEVLTRVGEGKYLQMHSTIENRVQELADPLNIVSGKDFLLPLQMFEAERTGGQRIQRKSFLFRLARHCNLQRLEALRHRILDIIEPNKAIEAAG